MTPRQYAKQLLEQLAADTKAELNRRMKERRKVKANDPKVQRLVERIKKKQNERRQLAARIQRLHNDIRKLEEDLYRKYRFILTRTSTLKRPRALVARDDYDLGMLLREARDLDRGFLVGEKTLKKFDFRFDEEDTDLVTEVLERMQLILAYLRFDAPVESDQETVFEDLKRIAEG